MTFNETNKENFEKSRLIHEGLLDPTDYEKKYTLLRKYITRGGFIKDRNGKWCKDGDKVEFETDECELQYDERSLIWRVFYVDSGGSTPISVGSISGFELIEPCEPDICKDFEEVEL